MSICALSGLPGALVGWVLRRALGLGLDLVEHLEALLGVEQDRRLHLRIRAVWRVRRGDGIPAAARVRARPRHAVVVDRLAGSNKLEAVGVRVALLARSGADLVHG